MQLESLEFNGALKCLGYACPELDLVYMLIDEKDARDD